MKIINLVENTEGSAHCGAEHGLSLHRDEKAPDTDGYRRIGPVHEKRRKTGR